VRVRAQTELFHFLLLDRLLRATGLDLYVLKGGVNLRFFFRSPRYSEAMDLDVDPERVAVETLKKNGYKILRDAAFRRVLATAEIVDLEINDPTRAKHTSTTQRFRVSLVTAAGQRLPTKVEFSRRGVDAAVVKVERIDPEVARRHGRTAFDVGHYIASAAAKQKIEALAGRPVPQARDAFDLYLLDSRGAIDRELLRSIESQTHASATANLLALDYDDWEGHVLEYLEEDAREEYEGRQTFERIQLALVELLERKA
jgi:hypothetical protein